MIRDHNVDDDGMPLPSPSSSSSSLCDERWGAREIMRLEDEEALPTERQSNSMNNTLLDDTNDDDDDDSMSDSSFNGYDALAKLSEEDWDDLHDIQEIFKHNEEQWRRGKSFYKRKDWGDTKSY